MYVEEFRQASPQGSAGSADTTTNILQLSNKTLNDSNITNENRQNIERDTMKDSLDERGNTRTASSDVGDDVSSMLNKHSYYAIHRDDNSNMVDEQRQATRTVNDSVNPPTDGRLLDKGDDIATTAIEGDGNPVKTGVSQQQLDFLDELKKIQDDEG